MYGTGLMYVSSGTGELFGFGQSFSASSNTDVIGSGMLKRARILIVEDEAIIAMHLAVIVEDYEGEVVGPRQAWLKLLPSSPQVQ